MTRLLIRTDGSVQALPNPVSLREAARLIGADTLDTVTLRNMQPLHVMLVDDAGWDTEVIESPGCVTLKPVRARKPVNAEATALYHQNCKPGTTHQIVGDVVIVPDEDYT